MRAAGFTVAPMSISLLLSFLPAWFGVAMFAQSDEVRTLVVQQEVIMRVPVRPAPPIAWDEEKGPKCIPARSIRAAMISGRNQVDFLFFNRSRMRARLSEDCLALDFYNGFYLTPEDGQVCAKRDGVHSRIGGSCRIERFRRLVPKFEN